MAVEVALETERLLFRRHEPGDIDPYCAMEADPDVRRYVGGRPRSRDEAEERSRRGLTADVSDRLILWATVYRPEGLYIGRCGVYPHFDDAGGGPVPGEGTLAFYLARPYWGRGLATEAGRALLRFGFDGLDLRRIVATVQAGNLASERLMEKLGLRHTGMERGEARSFHHYEVTPAEYREWAASPIKNVIW